MTRMDLMARIRLAPRRLHHWRIPPALSRWTLDRQWLGVMVSTALYPPLSPTAAILHCFCLLWICATHPMQGDIPSRSFFLHSCITFLFWPLNGFFNLYSSSSQGNGCTSYLELSSFGSPFSVLFFSFSLPLLLFLLFPLCSPSLARSHLLLLRHALHHPG
ncbi:hypothetical protein B0O80DRAFT_463840 [Mortierella sp. GBAus27b]|nr:hypothetical protein B0O80DRAFT_463840 [Mortierella sp. GBAus27b]